MTLSEIATLCPPPEGMEWRHYDPDGLIAAEDGKTVIVDPEDDNRIRVSAWNGDDNAHLYTIPTDLPAAYLRALTAVGLAPDAEKEALRGEVGSLRDALKVTEGVVGSAYRQVQALCADVADLRRRLTWTSEVPTEPGVYVVGRGVKPYDGSIMFRRWDEDEGKMERPWVDAFGLPWTDEQMKGRRFFALDNLKETP